jgi:bacterioferritin (cytochrome b1)
MRSASHLLARAPPRGSTLFPSQAAAEAYVNGAAQPWPESLPFSLVTEVGATGTARIFAVLEYRPKHRDAPKQGASIKRGESMTAADSREELIRRLNDALGWELRAEVMYSHYAAYVQGIHRLHLKAYFEGEAAESVTHATTVRSHIVKLGGVACTDRDKTKIVHTSDYRVMLAEAMKTEVRAGKTYKEFLEVPGVDSELYDAIEQIYFMEERSVEELKQLLGEA